ncbi:hypothetical protein SAMN02744133_108154 [Thalassospira xiamenensis M-5 = DSM 17429]|uniref:Uncharacterized protein n=1 Tax=Thalassospira xiamenensis M-5 = DSM 17429 TaxID=1123366 RepID=A0AB72ULA7_9PROT|nr:hypothetical protein [Thalassospira xiamenensis]AJD54427.1 hypothetical protein TH3_21773 [Thalassospira xiamenensis M-5 = DSM 17429]SIT22111.1 hypothetical protein SAMN02744133_108154 [Thalassospira xiamenensis M-5 = DSM 17429]
MSSNDVLVRLIGQERAAVEKVKQLMLAMGLEVSVDWDVDQRGAIGTFDATLRILDVQVEGNKEDPESGGHSSSGNDGSGQGGVGGSGRSGCQKMVSPPRRAPSLRLVHDRGAKGFDRVRLNIRRRALVDALARTLEGDVRHDPSKSARDCSCPVCALLSADEHYGDRHAEVFERIFDAIECRRGQKSEDLSKIYPSAEIDKALASIDFDPVDGH